MEGHIPARTVIVCGYTWLTVGSREREMFYIMRGLYCGLWFLCILRFTGQGKMSKPLTVKVSITGQSSFDMSLGHGGYTDVAFIVGLMLQAGKTLGEELEKHGVPTEVVEAAIRKIDIMELQEAAQGADE